MGGGRGTASSYGEGEGLALLCRYAAKLGVGSEKTNKIWFFTRLALLCRYAAKLGVGSEKTNKIWFFTRLALTLQ